MSRKLAVVISGAVSLGSYEAGVLYEVIEAIARHNENEKTNEDERIEIDVITGASAGGMTACLLAQHLLCSDQSLRDPSENPLYKAWVEEVDIRQLLDVEVDDHQFSLLQSKVVENIGQKYIEDEPQLTKNRHPAAASEIKIGVAMSNLNGYVYNISQQNPGTTNFGYTQYKDQFVCVARRSRNEVTLREETLLENTTGLDVWQDFRDTTWSELRKVGLSSGAFPFAFQAIQIHRDGGAANINGRRNRFSQRTGDFWYVDGGVFENEPIGMAQELVKQIDAQNQQPTGRYYLYVAPGERPLADNSFLQQNHNINLLQTGGALLGSIFQQARFQKWIVKGIQEPIFSITAQDFLLLGDVFSAFAGFLEEKFRAYDYNIGRELARTALNNQNPSRIQLADLLVFDRQTMPLIAWVVASEKSKIGGVNVNTWQEARIRLAPLALPVNPANRDQFQELRILMDEVDELTRKEILNQLISRFDSLVYLVINTQVDSQEQWKAKTLYFFIKGRLKKFLRNWLKRNILNLR